MPPRDDLPAWRSVLFVPVNVERFVDRAQERGADALLLDLEDSIAPLKKEEARAALPGAVQKLRLGKAEVGVRINRPLDLAVRDVEVAVKSGVSFLSLTKVEGPLHVKLIDELVEKQERRCDRALGSVRLIANVESAAAYFELRSIAQASNRLIGIGLGGEDFSSDCGMEPTAESLFMAKQQTVFAARAAGILPIGYIGSVANFSDTEGFRAIIRRSRRLGFVCGYCIHPNQVPILNEEFGPTAAEVASAEKIIASAEAKLSQGDGAFVMDGKMIDKPIIERAQSLLKRARAIAAQSSSRIRA